jgi:hypothetical protein
MIEKWKPKVFRVKFEKIEICEAEVFAEDENDVYFEVQEENFDKKISLSEYIGNVLEIEFIKERYYHDDRQLFLFPYPEGD